MSWANDYVGIPFRWHGSDRSGCSCWGLVRLVASDIWGRQLPRHDEIEIGAEKGEASPQPYMEGFTPIDLKDAKEGDLLHMWALYKSRKLPLHVGMVVEPGKVLHIEEGCGSVIVDYRKQPMNRRVIGAYRFA